MTQDALTESLNMLYASPLCDAEANEATRNLLALMELLIEIDQEHGITRPEYVEGQP